MASKNKANIKGIIIKIAISVGVTILIAALSLAILSLQVH